ncbi:MAG: hypothetical protein AABZ60_12600 [Planctomycetota bacterium]
MRFFCLICFFCLSSCIQNVRYETREIVHPDGTKSEESISVCPYCGQYADYESAHCVQCNRPYFWEAAPGKEKIDY